MSLNKYEVWATQGGPEISPDEKFDTLEEAQEYVADHWGEAAFCIKKPDGKREACDWGSHNILCFQVKPKDTIKHPKQKSVFKKLVKEHNTTMRFFYTVFKTPTSINEIRRHDEDPDFNHDFFEVFHHLLENDMLQIYLYGSGHGGAYKIGLLN